MPKRKYRCNLEQKPVAATAITELSLAHELIDLIPSKYHSLPDFLQCHPKIILKAIEKNSTRTTYASGWGDSDTTITSPKDFIPVSSIPVENIKKAFTERYNIRSLLDVEPGLATVLQENFNEQNMVYFADCFEFFSKELQEKFITTNFSLEEKQTILDLNLKLTTVVIKSTTSISDKIEIASSLPAVSLKEAMNTLHIDFSDNKTWNVLHMFFKNRANLYNGWPRYVLYFAEAAELILEYGTTTQIMLMAWVEPVYKKYYNTLSYEENLDIKNRFDRVISLLKIQKAV